MKNDKRKKAIIIFIVMLIIIIALFAASVLKTNAYNNLKHKETFSGELLFSADHEETNPVSIKAIPRSSTWTKAFDLNNEGITEHNFQAYTYDFSISNNTGDEVSDFKFRLDFAKEVFLLSAWNGALEIHQNVSGEERVATVPDLREFEAGRYVLETVTFDGEALIRMNAGDYLVYIPNSSISAMEVPISPHQGTTPGMLKENSLIRKSRILCYD